jgi:HSP20 family molecular chaperone IbpA
MWLQALALLDRADQMHRQFFQLRSAPAHPAWEPPVDIVETARDIQIAIALPGVARESVSVALNGRDLTVSAVRTLPGNQTDAVIRRLEIPHGRFERNIQLPDLPLRLAESQLSGGCLYLTLRKAGA